MLLSKTRGERSQLTHFQLGRACLVRLLDVIAFGSEPKVLVTLHEPVLVATSYPEPGWLVGIED